MSDTQPRTPAGRICRHCWWRRATPGFDRCAPCFFLPEHNRPNWKWRHLIDEVNAADTSNNDHRRRAA